MAIFGLGKKNNPKPSETDNKTTKPIVEKKPEPEKKGFFKRLSSGLSKTRQQLTSGLTDSILGAKVINEDLIEEIETILLSSDIGVDVTESIIDDLTKRIGRRELHKGSLLLEQLQKLLVEILKPAEQPLIIDKTARPFTIMMIGINGSGKTTTIGKLTKQLKNENYSVMLAAGDTFRAAAIEQLQTWGERNDVAVVAQHSGADCAAVCFDALDSAKSKNMDVLIADTAGRLHTQSHLMEELKKVKRVMSKLDSAAPQEVLLVLDASIGQNALQQAKLFGEAIGVTGLCITKLDGTAKGGIVFAIVKELGLPIRFIGVGEGIDDLQPFSAQDFVDALFEKH
jgi:fused signal recognition particle receptor